MMKTRIVLGAFLALCFFATAVCGCETASETASETNEPLTGKYVIAEIADDPDGVTFADLDAMYKAMGVDIQDFLYIAFLEDGQYVLVLFGETEAAGAYVRDGSVLTLAAGDAETQTTAEIAGNRIVWTYGNGAKLIFAQDETR